jgi:uncharacterized damage-inducible protein DinB
MLRPMTDHEETDTRAEPPLVASEREMLGGWLDFHRATLVHKCAGLTEEQLKTRSCEPSTLTLLGLLRHMTEVEHGWFADFDGRRRSPIYYTEDRPDDDFDALDSASVDDVFAEFRAECDRARSTYAEHDIDDTFTSRRGREYSMRWVVTHMIEEYARHNGHADLLRERIDGAVGV